MEIELTVKATKDLDFWKKTGNQHVLKRIRELTAATLKKPFLRNWETRSFKTRTIRKMVKTYYTN